MATFEDVATLETAQAGDLNAIEQAIAKAEADIEALDALSIRESDRRDKVQEIRDKAIVEIRDRRAAAQKRLQEAKAMSREFEPQAFRRSAIQGAAAKVSSLIPIYQNAPTSELFGFLDDAVTAGNIAAAEALRHEFDKRKRTAEEIRRFAAILSRLKLPVDEASEKLANVHSMGAMIDVRITELLRGRRDPMRRLNAMRTTGSIGRPV